jgi:hypothetical protein
MLRDESGGSLMAAIGEPKKQWEIEIPHEAPPVIVPEPAPVEAPDREPEKVPA